RILHFELGWTIIPWNDVLEALNHHSNTLQSIILKSVIFRWWRNDFALASCPNLEKIHITCCGSVTDENFQPLTTALFPKLKELVFTRTNVPFAIIEALLVNCGRTLQRLDFGSSLNFDLLLVRTIAECHEIRDFTWYPSCNVDLFKQFLGQQRQLKTIRVTDRGAWDSSPLLDCTYTRRLNKSMNVWLTRASQVSQNALESKNLAKLIRSQHRLACFRLWGVDIPHEAQMAICALSSQYQTLKQIEISGYSFINPEPFASMAACVNLESLKLNLCKVDKIAEPPLVESNLPCLKH
ncbi:4626_t:CDS:2, partial [Paraglomus occultum]